MATKLTMGGITDDLEGWSCRTGLPVWVLKQRVKARRRAKNPADVTRILAPLMWDAARYRESERSMLARKVASDASRRSSVVAVIAAAKSAPCMDCGQRFPDCAMDFDHRDPSQKRFQLSSARGRSVASVVAEIAKCDLVCSNCHRVRTWKARGSMFRRGEMEGVGVPDAEAAEIVHCTEYLAEELPLVRWPHVRLIALRIAAELVRELPGSVDGREQERIDLSLRIALRKQTAPRDRSLGLRTALGLARGKLCPGAELSTRERRMFAVCEGL